jgi:nitrogenase iron protein
MRIAVYGKGGIGKSTLSANLSAASALKGQRVLQIGCDPKQDSTRLLLGGERIRTVLEYLRDIRPEEQRLEDVVIRGWRGIDCVEAGGPEPGVGCAGRGILSAFSILDRLGCAWEEYDTIIYDVLGDVVCGGFAVPLRKGFAETVLVVTSEELMSIYAANNTLRGVSNMEQGERRSVGLIVNRRERDGGIESVRRFADAVAVPILAVIPRSGLLREAEQRAQTLIEMSPDNPVAEMFMRLAAEITSSATCSPRPLNNDALEEVMLDPTSSPDRGVTRIVGSADAADRGSPASREAGSPSGGSASKPATASGLENVHSPGCIRGSRSAQGRYLSKSLIAREPLHGCAFTGAVNTLTQIGDAVTLAHGPRSCTHIAASTMLSSGLASLRRHDVRIPEQLAPALVSTEMTDATMIHGGLDVFRAGLKEAVRRQPKAVFVATTCPAGVIGEDVDQVVREFERPDTPMLRVSTDGDIEGDYLQGVINACTEGAGRLIDPRSEPGDDCVNIVAEKNIAINADINFAEMERLLTLLGLRVHCRFVRRTTVDRLRTYLRAPLNLPAYLDHLGRVLRDFLSRQFGCVFAHHPFPSGFHETERWLLEIARFFGREEQGAAALDKMRLEYENAIVQLRPDLAGKRLMLVTYNHDVDWILETAFDLDMEIVKVGIVNYSQDGQYRTRYADRLTAETGYNPQRRADDIMRLKPDLFLGNYQSPGLPQISHYDTVPLCPNTGHLGGLALARRWRRLLNAPIREGWRKDEARLLHSRSAAET